MNIYCANCGENLGIFDIDQPYYWESDYGIFDLCRDCYDAFTIEVEHYLRPYKKEVSLAKKNIEHKITLKIKNNLKLQNNED